MPEAANLIYIVFKMQNAQHSTMGESKESGRSWESGRGTAEKLLKFNKIECLWSGQSVTIKKAPQTETKFLFLIQTLKFYFQYSLHF